MAAYRFKPGTHQAWAAKALAGLCGHLQPYQVTGKAVRLLNGKISSSASPFTRRNRANALRLILQKLEDEGGTPDLTPLVLQVPHPRPRNITATERERAMLLAASPPHLRCWLLLCSDLAIRSGTAAQLRPSDYDPVRRELTYTTKYQARQVMPVTAELAALLDTCTLPHTPFVAQIPRAHVHHNQPLHPLGHMQADSLRKLFAALRRKLGITRKLTAHDLRRTTAMRVYDASRDIRLVQAILGHGDMNSTIWYLDHHLTPVPVSTLELAKLNPLTKGLQ